MLPDVSSADLARYLIALWSFATGAAIGSFLNVVVYRVPEGLSLIHPPSRCPFCEHPIRWYDNLPVLGWILLRGRCRDCRRPIAMRYPIVEALVGAIFLVLVIFEVFAGGANLPLRTVRVGGESFAPDWTALELWRLYGFHLVVLCTLLPAMLIAWDEKPVPARLFAIALAVGLVAPWFWPRLHPVPALPAIDGWLSGAVDSLAGAAVGLGLGIISGEGRKPNGLLPSVICVGAFLGWQAVGVLAVVTMICHWGWSAVRRMADDIPPLPATLWLSAATLGWLLVWSRLVGWFPWLG